jgi:hypothetical protein
MAQVPKADNGLPIAIPPDEIDFWTLLPLECGECFAPGNYARVSFIFWLSFSRKKRTASERILDRCR